MSRMNCQILLKRKLADSILRSGLNILARPFTSQGTTLTLGPEKKSTYKFFGEPKTRAEIVGFKVSAKILGVGESLFLLRNTTGFSEFCERWKKQDFRSTYYELVSARIFAQRGYNVKLTEPKGIKGDDFDFQASRGDELINAEVTALTAEEYSESTAWKRSIINVSSSQRPHPP